MTPAAPSPAGPPCDRPPCPGRIKPNGFCSDCGRQPLQPPTVPLAPHPPLAPLTPSQPSPPADLIETATTRTAARARQRTARLFAVREAGGGLLELPYVDLLSRDSLVLDDPRPPSRGQVCANEGCGHVVGAPYAGQPALTSGFCRNCRHPFDFAPQLGPGDLLGDQYRVVGCIAFGGMGWVYLAEDTKLDDRPVAIKGLINTEDRASLEMALEERRHLRTLDHPNIVRIINYVTHPARNSRQVTGYIVMEFVGGTTLAQIKEFIAHAEPPYDGPRLYEHILTYGCLILDALEYLHGERLVYCDMKPGNVMHHEGKIKIIDLGAMYRLGEPKEGGRPVITPHYAPPEVERHGFAGLGARSDIYSVGRTLKDLSLRAERPEQQPPGLAATSYEHAIARATAPDPRQRFASAREMAEQLRGILRETRSLRLEEEHPEPSTLFAPTAALLDASLGRIPPLEHWLDAAPADGGPAALAPRPLGHGLPDPDRVVPGLPVPFPDPKDPGTPLLITPTDAGPRRLIEQLDASRYEPESPEIQFRQCRAHLELGRLPLAARRLAKARRVIGAGDAPYDWRLSWHRALLLLARGQVEVAARQFGRVYRVLPGEYAPKLALGYCSERLGNLASAEWFYQAVWQRNRSQGSAAFGLARLRLAAGDRNAAVRVLDGVPMVSRHYDAAQLAAVRIRAGRLGPAPYQLPSVEDFQDAVRRLPRLDLDDGQPSGEARDRLNAEVLQTALDWARTHSADEVRAAARGFAAPLFAAPRFAPPRPRRRPRRGRHRTAQARPDPEAALRALLEASLRRIARRQARTADEHGALVDRANSIRPLTRA
ncbi:tetratricopeptide repeat protein [Streptomyces varsoviensis]|uniref:serine/threonine-protein kinase n=1 Tax=Streptomyces varsoviensis TaxID=67373 RepID=UPI0033C56C81